MSHSVSLVYAIVSGTEIHVCLQLLSDLEISGEKRALATEETWLLLSVSQTQPLEGKPGPHGLKALLECCGQATNHPLLLVVLAHYRSLGLRGGRNMCPLQCQRLAHKPGRNWESFNPLKVIQVTFRPQQDSIAVNDPGLLVYCYKLTVPVTQHLSS